MELYLAGSQQSFERVEREDDLMNLYLAGEYVFTGERKLDIGIIRNRLLSFDYQKKFVDTMIDWKNNMELYLAGADKFCKCFDTDNNDLVVVQDIPIFSYCEHHLALMYNMTVSIAYIPNGKVLGLSKFARIADMVGKRLQLQERIGSDIAEIVQMATGSNDVLVVVQGEHSCMTARGIKSRGAKTRTATIRGQFENNVDLRKEAYSLMSLN